MQDPPPRIPKYALRSVFREHFSEKLGMLDAKNDDDFTKHWITSHVRLKHRYGNTGLGVGRLHQSCPNLHSIVVNVPKALPKKETDSGIDSDSDNSDSDLDNERGVYNKNASHTDEGGLKRRQSFPSLDNNEWMAEYGNFL
jgi:hypothetical protein